MFKRIIMRMQERKELRKKVYLVEYYDENDEIIDTMDFTSLEYAEQDIKYNADLCIYGKIYLTTYRMKRFKFIKKVESINRYNS